MGTGASASGAEEIRAEATEALKTATPAEVKARVDKLTVAEKAKLQEAMAMVRTQQDAEAKAELLARHFLQCGKDGEGPSVRVMQFNVLADGMGQKQFEGRVPVSAMAFARRSELALGEVCRVSPDVLCLQEVNHYSVWAEEFRKLGYEGVFVPKYDDSYPQGHQTPPAYYGGAPTDGCAIFVRRESWRISSHFHKRFAELTGDASCSQVVMLAALESCAAPEHKLVVSCSHLKSGPGKGNAALRLGQCQAWAKLLADSLADAAWEAWASSPVVLCGDMNENMSEAPKGGVATLCETLKLGSSYAIGQGRDPLFTAIDGAWRSCLDYILISQGLRPSSLFQVPGLPKGALPSAQYPSDHLALAADLRFVEA